MILHGNRQKRAPGIRPVALAVPTPYKGAIAVGGSRAPVPAKSRRQLSRPAQAGKQWVGVGAASSIPVGKRRNGRTIRQRPTRQDNFGGPTTPSPMAMGGVVGRVGGGATVGSQ